MPIFSPPINKISSVNSQSFQIDPKNNGPIISHESDGYYSYIQVNQGIHIVDADNSYLVIYNSIEGTGISIHEDCIYICGNVAYHEGNLNKSNLYNTFNVLGILSTPPVDPYNGDTYLVGLNPTGDWKYYEGSCMIWDEDFEYWYPYGNSYI